MLTELRDRMLTAELSSKNEPLMMRTGQAQLSLYTLDS